MASTKVESNNNIYNKLDKVDDSYEDDFEKDIDSDEQSSSPRKANGSDDDKDVISPPPIKISPPSDQEVEKGQQELESPGKEKSVDEPSDNDDSEPDVDAYSFTEDQKRAMMELMVQKQEDVDLLDEEPPEYNVKGRLEQLNADLANDPTPVEGDRETRVGFKPEIVDLVAPPPPDYSDDESQHNSARGEPQPSETATTATSSSTTKTATTDSSTTGSSSSNNDGEGKKDTVSDPNKKQFVVERDGNFSVLSANELTPSERALYIKEEKSPKKAEKQRDNQTTKDNSHSNRGSDDKGGNKSNNNNLSGHVAPRPPNRPRPNTANSGPRRNVRAAQSPRPKSASQSIHFSNLLDGFNYESPYAMTSEEKEAARKQHERQEEEKIKKERQKREEEEERKKYNDQVFQAWLKRKSEEDKKRPDHNEGRQQTEQERREENEQAYKTWLKEKRTQGKKDKLLKKRQQQEQMEGYFFHQREECDRAFKEWLKKKNAEIKRQQALERQKSRMYRVQIKRSKKTQALVKALKESQAFRYVDYYGYRYLADSAEENEMLS